MSLWPKSLVGRNALLIVGLMVLAQLVSSVTQSRSSTFPVVEK